MSQEAEKWSSARTARRFSPECSGSGYRTK